MTLNRRDFVKGAAAAPSLSASAISIEPSRELVNDVHTGLNPTWVDQVVRPTSIVEIQNCVILTPYVAGGNSEMQRARDICRHLQRAATKRGGSFYLTCNRFAAHSELDAAYPQFSDSLMLKKKYDPSEIFQREWYRYYQQLYK